MLKGSYTQLERARQVLLTLQLQQQDLQVALARTLVHAGRIACSKRKASGRAKRLEAHK